MSKYKYELGETVRYRTFSVKDITCPCCEHVETEYKNIKRRGKITSRDKDYSMDSGADFQMNKQVQPDGTTLMIPTLEPITVPRKENFYIINGQTIIEEAIAVRQNSRLVFIPEDDNEKITDK